MNALTISLAYKYVATAMMLAEANYCAERLHLPSSLPIVASQIRQAYVAPPRLLRFLGSLDTDKYSFGFSESGTLRFITRLHRFGDAPLPQIQRRLAKVDPGMTTSAAYKLATNWLTAVCVDLPALERTHPATVRQH